MKTLPLILAALGPSLLPVTSRASDLPNMAADSSKSIASVSVGTAPGATIPANFLGLSHEWGSAQGMIGDTQSGINLIYRQLVANLLAYGSPLLVRIGGNSTDKTIAPTASSVAPFAEVAKALGVHFTLGVNLGAGDPKLAADQAKAYVSQMPAGSLDAIEIGNEPDDYFKNGRRPPTYSDQDYFTDFARWKEVIVPVLSTGVRLMGPAWAFKHKPESVQSMVAELTTVPAIFSQHFYGSNPKAQPPDDFLLTPAAAMKGPAIAVAEVGMTHARGALFRMAEMNSIANGGVAGISDAFGSALWAVDTMFELAKVGVDGVNWHSTSGNAYSLFYFSSAAANRMKTYTLDSVHPLYYGLLFFQAAVANGARVLPVDLLTQANLKAWATVDSAGTPRLVLINKDEALTGNVAVHMPGYNHASILRLSAPSYKSTNGVTFAGQTFDGSVDGKAKGAKTVETVNGSDGAFQIPMPLTSAALAIFSK